jgi:hypothetical protein
MSHSLIVRTISTSMQSMSGHSSEQASAKLMHARIGVMRALNRNVVREFDSSRKEPQWGRRKLKRDM